MDFLNRSKEVSRSKLEIIISHSIFIQIPQNLYQNSHHNKIYKIMYIKQRIKVIENVTSWRSTSGNARSKAWQASNILQNTCNEVWWLNGGLKLCRSSSICICHSWVLELHMHNSGPNLMIQGLISAKSTLKNQNMEEDSRLMWENFELRLRENFGGKNFLDLEMVKWSS
jgi:hypothetical protein